MAEWRDYRMWRQVVNGVSNAGCAGFWLGEWKPTDITFRGRSQAEAQKKADKFWREGRLGHGSMTVIPADEQMPIAV
jgi:hypothetical protein